MVFSALTIAGSDSGGGAGAQADLKTFAAHRVHGLSIITSLTAQNTMAVREVSDVPIKFIEAQFDALHEDFRVDAAKIGMLSNKKIIRTVSRKIGSYPLVVDPVMVSESGGRLLDEDAISTLKDEILPKATLATPNLFEAEILSDMKITKSIDMKEACKRISKLGCNVVVKGGHLNATDILYTKKKFYSFPSEKLGGSFHGSGCTYSAAVAANLALGFDLRASVSNAKEFIKGTLETSYRPGKGDIRAVNQVRTAFEDEYDDVLRAVRGAVLELEGMGGLTALAPEVGMNLCFARKGANSIADVAGVSGRITKVGDKMRAHGNVKYGASKHIANVILAAMKFDATQRAAANIKYRPWIIERIENLGAFAMSSFDRIKEPEKMSTMDWGTGQAIKSLGRVPDLIYDLGGIGKEPMIRIIGKDPSDVSSKLRKVLEAVNG
jgi:hydroxymethylpyrimidine/phosphomethylpyrimidine kinase